MDELILELKNYNNALVMAGAWAMIEYIWSPLAHAIVMSPAMVRWRKTMQKGSNGIKKASGLAWCSLAVWIPGAQPALCEADHDGTCQTVFARVSIGIILGAALSGGHWAGKAALVRFGGRKKLHKIKCINCPKKNKAIEVEDWDDKCPVCGKNPHNIEKS